VRGGFPLVIVRGLPGAIPAVLLSLCLAPSRAAPSTPQNKTSSTSPVSACAVDVSRMDDPGSDVWDSEALSKVVLDPLQGSFFGSPRGTQRGANFLIGLLAVPTVQCSGPKWKVTQYQFTDG